MGKSSSGSSSAFDAWMKSQKDYFDTLTDVTEKFQSALNFSARPTGEGADPAGVYRQWQETFGKYYEGILRFSPLTATHDTMSKLFGSADTYVRLYEFWAPMAKALQEQVLSGKAYGDLYDPQKYAELLKTIFGFGPADTAEEFASQASKIVETLVSKGELLLRPWSEALAKNMEALAGAGSGDIDAGAKMFHNLYAAFESTYGKAFKMPAVGKDREQIELLLKTMDKYSVFLARNTEYQQSIFATGRKAMEKVIGAFADKLKGGAETAGFDEFFQMWTSVQEREYLDLFRTEEFARRQGAVLEAALEARSHFNKLMELFLSDYPVALRSEMDDLYKTVYGLKKSIRELKKEGAGTSRLQEEIAALKRQVAALEGKRPSRAAAAGAKGKATRKTAVRRKAAKRDSGKGGTK